MAEELNIEQDVFCFRIRSAQTATGQMGYGRGTKYRINIEQDVFCSRIRSAQIATRQTGYGRGTKYRTRCFLFQNQVSPDSHWTDSLWQRN